MRDFTKSVLVITLFSLGTRLIGFVFRIFLSRVLGAELLGVYQMAQSIFMVLLTVISSGLPLVMSREIAKDPQNQTQVRQITRAGLLIGVGVALILCLIVVVAQNLFGFIFSDHRCVTILLALLPAIVASSVYCVLRATWWGEKKFFLLGLTELIEQILRIVLFVVLLGFTFYFADLAHLTAWAFSGACILSAVVVVIIFWKGHKTGRQPHPAQISYVKPLLKSATPITGVRFLGSIAFPLISVLLPLRLVASGWTNLEAVAHYGVIVGMTFPLLTIPSTVISALATALVPELSTMANQKRWSAVRHQVKTVLKFSIFVNFIFIPVYVTLGTGIGNFLYADPNAGIYLARSAWVMIPLSLSQITTTTLNSLNKEGLAMRNYFLGSVVLFVAIWFLPGIIGADAVLVGLGLSMVISTMLNLVAIHRFTDWHDSDATLSTIFAYTAISIPAGMLGYAINQFCALCPTLIQLTLAGVSTCAGFFALAWGTNMIILPKKRR